MVSALAVSVSPTTHNTGTASIGTAIIGATTGAGVITVAILFSSMLASRSGAGLAPRTAMNIIRPVMATIRTDTTGAGPTEATVTITETVTATTTGPEMDIAMATPAVTTQKLPNCNAD